MTDARLLDLHFDAPPVVEVIFGLEYPAIEGWKAPHYGLYWSHVREDYPECETLQPVVSQPRIEFVMVPRVRCLFSNPQEQKVVQLQEDRFYYNWRKVSADGEYPEFDVIRPIFDHEWDRFKHFLESEAFAIPPVEACELTYVNHLRRGREWEELSDLSDVFTLIPKNALTESPGLEQFMITITRPLAGAVGAITLNIQPAVTVPTGDTVVQFTLAVRGHPSTPDDAGVSTWLEAAHQAILRNFIDATTPLMHKQWGRKP